MFLAGDSGAEIHPALDSKSIQKDFTVKRLPAKWLWKTQILDRLS